MNTDVIDPGLRLIEDERTRREAWIQAISPVFVPTLDKATPISRDIGFRCWKVDDTLLSAIEASPQTIERTASQIAAQAVDHVILRLYESGRSSIDTPEGDAGIEPGTFVLFDLSQRARSISKGMTGINLAIPRRRFDRRIGDVGDLHRGRFSQKGSPLLKLLADHVRNKRACLDEADPSQRALLASATVALCNAALTPARDSAHNLPAIAAIEIRQWIDDNLHRHDLDVETLCGRFGMSRSPLYALFEADGGVMTFIRNRRLARAMRMLSGADGGPPPRVSSVAYAVGYVSPKMFSKAFQARYGVNPRDVDASFGSDARWETGNTLLSWITGL